MFTDEKPCAEILSCLEVNSARDQFAYFRFYDGQEQLLALRLYDEVPEGGKTDLYVINGDNFECVAVSDDLSVLGHQLHCELIYKIGTRRVQYRHGVDFAAIVAKMKPTDPYLEIV